MKARSKESLLAYQKLSPLLEIVIKDRSRIYLRTFLIAVTHIQLCAPSTALRHSIAFRKSQGILTLCPSAPAFAITLGPTNPSLINIAKETLVFRRVGISPTLRLLVSTFLLLVTPKRLTATSSLRTRTLSYHCQCEALAAETRRLDADLRRKIQSAFFCVVLRSFRVVPRSVLRTDTLQFRYYA